MAIDALWALHFDHGIPRRYYLSDLNAKEDRPYKGNGDSKIALDESGECWSLYNPRTELVEEHRLCEPYMIDEENFLTVYRYPEQDVRAYRALKSYSERHGQVKARASP